jgi:putative nucleotidyltransferase with HDIG domain
MPSAVHRLFSQPLVAILASLTAAGAVFTLSQTVSHHNVPTRESLAVSMALVVCVALAYRFPVHIRHNLKLYMATVPLVLLAMVGSPAMAGVFAFVGILVGEMLARPQTGAYLSDVLASAARYCIVVSLTSATMHIGPIDMLSVRLVLAVFVYWLLEAVTMPIVVTPVNGEPPHVVTLTFLREVSLTEGAQYGIAVLGCLLVRNYPLALGLLLIPAALVYSAFKRATEIQESTVLMLESMADAVDLRDPTTGGHSRRVAHYTAAILRQLGKSGPEAALVISAARVHDIGKIGLPDSVLLKEGKLTDEEIAIMQTHPEAGAQLLRRYKEFARGIDIVRHHHERIDGEGYPGRLRDQHIPFGAKIVAVADSYDAMTSDRPYRRGMTPTAAKQILLDGRGSQWDAQVVDAFFAAIGRSQDASPAGLPVFNAPTVAAA